MISNIDARNYSRYFVYPQIYPQTLWINAARTEYGACNPQITEWYMMNDSNANPYLACLAAGLFSFYDLFQLSIFNVISLPLISTFHLNTFTLGLFSSTFLIANAVGLIILGLVIDRYSVRYIALFFLTLTTLSSFGFAYSQSIILDIIFRSFQGLASAASLLVCIRTTSEWFKSHANFAVGAGIAIAVCGGITGNSIFAHFIVHYGWRNGLIAAGFLGILLLILVYLWLYDPRYIQVRNFKTIFTELKTALSRLQNILAGIYLGLMSTPIFILATLWGNYYLIKIYHTTQTKAALFSSFLFIGLMIGSPLWGRIADKIMSQTKAMLLGCSLVILLSLLLFSGQLSLFQVGFMFFGLGLFSSVQNLAYVIVCKTNPTSIISTATALTAVVLNIVGAFLQPLFGYILTKTTPVNAGLVLFLPAFCMCFVLIVLMRGRVSNGRK